MASLQRALWRVHGISVEYAQNFVILKCSVTSREAEDARWGPARTREWRYDTEHKRVDEFTEVPLTEFEEEVGRAVTAELRFRVDLLEALTAAAPAPAAPAPAPRTAPVDPVGEMPGEPIRRGGFTEIPPAAPAPAPAPAPEPVDGPRQFEGLSPEVSVIAQRLLAGLQPAQVHRDQFATPVGHGQVVVRLTELGEVIDTDAPVTRGVPERRIDAAKHTRYVLGRGHRCPVCRSAGVEVDHTNGLDTDEELENAQEVLVTYQCDNCETTWRARFVLAKIESIDLSDTDADYL